MKKVKRNIKYSNSRGISGKEYLLGSQAGRTQNRELNNDFDYLDKLSPEEFAWLAEFNAATTSGQLADNSIVGEENAEKLNNQLNRRKAWVDEKHRRTDLMAHRSKGKGINVADESGHNEEIVALQEYYADLQQTSWEEADDEIDRFWEEKNS